MNILNFSSPRHQNIYTYIGINIYIAINIYISKKDKYSISKGNLNLTLHRRGLT